MELRVGMGPAASSTARVSQAGGGGLVVVIAGPTAVGKSAAALELADLLQGRAEMVSADSVQLYKGLDIGSNKPTAAEQARCKTHLIDWLEPTSPCAAGAWTRQAMLTIDKLHAKGVVPIVCGGSCMYLDWLIHGEPDAAASSGEGRATVEAELLPLMEKGDWEAAKARLAAIDPAKAAGLTFNDWRRLVRHLEAARAETQRSGRAMRDGYDIRSFFLCPPDRRELYDRIDARCLAMLRVGFLEEVASLLEREMLLPDTPAVCAIGYRQAVDYLCRPQPEDADAEALSQFLKAFGTASRNYAKSQLHWFAQDSSVMWLEANPHDPVGVAREILRLARLPADEFQAARAADTALREASQQQGAAMGTFASRLTASALQQASIAGGVDLRAMLQIADGCTKKVPEASRKAPAEAATVLVPNCHAGDVPFGRVFWNGRHRLWGWGAPLGKLHKQGLQVFCNHGWQRVEESYQASLPLFCWSTRKAADFPAHGPADAQLPLIRPFPQDFSQHLDDKLLCAMRLMEAGHGDIHPLTWAADDFLQAEPSTYNFHNGPWFLKHSQGVKGNSVYVYDHASSLLQRLEELGNKGRRSFLVQQGVSPPSLRNGRKWVLRAHALLRGTGAGLELYCHKDIILLEHGHVYTEDASVRAAHISSAGSAKYWPQPVLLEDEVLVEQVRSCASKAFAAVWARAPRPPYAPDGAELCQVFGLDLVCDAGGKLWLLEVNSYPAIASGTMEHVNQSIYTALVRDVLSFVVMPRVDGSEPDMGGFVKLDVEPVA